MTSKAHMLWTSAVTSIALFMVLTLTIFSEAVPPERRGVALGAWAALAASPSRPAEVHEPASSRVL
ncbi:MAG TPA: hypothetical protein VFP78_05470 [Solirubrobacteraceae bacterium]|nr:hypothetical protein [Solirubrobacteraceae bacterium]